MPTIVALHALAIGIFIGLLLALFIDTAADGIAVVSRTHAEAHY